MRSWEKMLSERDIEVHEKSGHGKKQTFGKRPVILVIDPTYDFVGDNREETILESIVRFPNSCGPDGWNAVDAIEELITVARERKVPVMYSKHTKGDSDQSSFDLGSWRHKLSRAKDASSVEEESKIVEQIKPRKSELVISKRKPSPFFGTNLISYLIDLNVDTIICVGGTTSGCVRAAVVDGFSYGFRMFVVEEGSFDRFHASQAINLFDINAKYADVILLEDAIEYLNKCSTDIYEESGLQL